MLSKVLQSITNDYDAGNTAALGGIVSALVTATILCGLFLLAAWPIDDGSRGVVVFICSVIFLVSVAPAVLIIPTSIYWARKQDER
jgi:hypothetical protein